MRLRRHLIDLRHHVVEGVDVGPGRHLITHIVQRPVGFVVGLPQPVGPVSVVARVPREGDRPGGTLAPRIPIVLLTGCLEAKACRDADARGTADRALYMTLLEQQRVGCKRVDPRCGHVLVTVGTELGTEIIHRDVEDVRRRWRRVRLSNSAPAIGLAPMLTGRDPRSLVVHHRYRSPWPQTSRCVAAGMPSGDAPES